MRNIHAPPWTPLTRLIPKDRIHARWIASSPRLLLWWVRSFAPKWFRLFGTVLPRFESIFPVFPKNQPSFTDIFSSVTDTVSAVRINWPVPSPGGDRAPQWILAAPIYRTIRASFWCVCARGASENPQQNESYILPYSSRDRSWKIRASPSDASPATHQSLRTNSSPTGRPILSQGRSHPTQLSI